MSDSRDSLEHKSGGPSFDYGTHSNGLAGPSGSNRRKFTVTALIAGALALTVIAVLLLTRQGSAEEGDSEEAANVVVSVKAAKAERGEIAPSLTALGSVVPVQQATVSAKIGSTIQSMALLKNKKVKAGDVLVRLESRDLRAQQTEAGAALREAEQSLKGVSSGSIPQNNAQDEKAIRDTEANLENAQATYKRRQVLLEEGGISKKDVEASDLAVKTAENDLRLARTTAELHAKAINPTDRGQAEEKVKQAQDHLRGLEAQLSYAVIRSPISGTVTDQFQYQGEFAAPGAKLLTVSDLSEVIIKAPFADVVAASLNPGDPASVRPTSGATGEIDGKIELVSRAADPSSRTVEVWVRLPNKDGRFKAADTAEVTVSTADIKDAVLVPASAVTLDATTADQGLVMVVDDKSIAHSVKVTVGVRTKDKMQITSGLKGGETVVTEGAYALPDGAKVEINTGEKQPGGEPEKDSGDKD